MQRLWDPSEVQQELQKCGHGEHELWSPDLIVKLRMYFWRLPTVDQRQFLAPGVRCDLDRERLHKGGSLSNVKLHVNHRLERPEILEKRLTAALLDPSSRLPVPAVSECFGVCQKFLLRAVGRSKKFFHSFNPQRKSRSCDSTEEDRVFKCNRIRQVFKAKLAIKKKFVTDWLSTQRQLHLVMPTEDSTVVPFVDKREAHAMFVLDTERQLQFEHRERSRDICFASGCAIDDLQEEVFIALISLTHSYGMPIQYVLVLHNLLKHPS